MAGHGVGLRSVGGDAQFSRAPDLFGTARTATRLPVGCGSAGWDQHRRDDEGAEPDAETDGEYERELIVERVNAGIAASRAAGTRFGRPLSDPRRSRTNL